MLESTKEKNSKIWKGDRSAKMEERPEGIWRALGGVVTGPNSDVGAGLGQNLSQQVQT